LTVFTINETEFGWEEIAAAAQGWGANGSRFVAEGGNSLACLAYARKPVSTRRRRSKEAATAFRYSHNLISADETQNLVGKVGDGPSTTGWLACADGCAPALGVATG
jgi:hypothetical protein